MIEADKMTKQEREELTRQIENETNEDKQAICNALCAALQLTREGADIERLVYHRVPGEEYVFIDRTGNRRDYVNVACDSGAAMIRDIMRALM